MFNKDRVNLRKNSGKMYLSMISFIIIGLGFFLTSGFVFNEKVEILSSPLNENIKINSTNDIQIIDWFYDKEKNEMEVVINTKKLDNTYQKIEFKSYQRSDESEVETEKLYQYEDYYVVRISDLDRNYIQVALDIVGLKENENESNDDNESQENEPKREVIKTLYADYREVKSGNVSEREDKDYIEYVTQLIIENIESEIKSTNEKIDQDKDKIKQIKNRISTLKEEKVYQTEEEKLTTDNDINALEISVEEIEKRILTLENEIKKYNEKIEKTKQKEREIILNQTN